MAQSQPESKLIIGNVTLDFYKGFCEAIRKLKEDEGFDLMAHAIERAKQSDTVLCKLLDKAIPNAQHPESDNSAGHANITIIMPPNHRAEVIEQAKDEHGDKNIGTPGDMPVLPQGEHMPGGIPLIEIEPAATSVEAHTGGENTPIAQTESKPCPSIKPLVKTQHN